MIKKLLVIEGPISIFYQVKQLEHNIPAKQFPSIISAEIRYQLPLEFLKRPPYYTHSDDKIAWERML